MQMALADSVIGELHLLEQMSSDEHLGSLAEAVLEAVKGHPEAARRVDQVSSHTMVLVQSFLSYVPGSSFILYSTSPPPHEWEKNAVINSFIKGKN